MGMFEIKVLILLVFAYLLGGYVDETLENGSRQVPEAVQTHGEPDASPEPRPGAGVGDAGRYQDVIWIVPRS